VFLSDGSSKTQPKTFNKKVVTKIVFGFFVDFYHVFGRFSVRGVQKHQKKYFLKKQALVLFWPLTHPPTTGVTDLPFFGGPLPGGAQAQAGLRRRAQGPCWGSIIWDLGSLLFAGCGRSAQYSTALAHHPPPTSPAAS
jgi:hypothetical protein